MRKPGRVAGIVAGTLFFCLLLQSLGNAAKRAASATNETTLRDRAARFLREKFGVPDSVKLTVSPCRNSVNPDYYDCSVTTDDGKQPKSQNISVSKDGRYLATSSMYALGTDASSDIVRTIREVFRLPATTRVSVGPLRDSTVPNFFETTITADDGQKKQTPDFFVTKDKRYLVLGAVLTLLSRGEILHSISTRNQPCAGPSNAPVTIVEYADLECPTCARVHEFLERDLLPKYGDKVRVVFKEYPLPMHDWARTAAIASQCSYQINPAAFLNYRSLIFQHQASINVTNVRDLLLDYGEQAGVDRLKLAACIDSNASLPRLEENLREAEKLQVSRTPTCFVNGRIVVGEQPRETFYKIIDDALRAQ